MTAPKTKRKAVKASKRRAGRPQVAVPKASVTLRFSPKLIAKLDAWAAIHGDMGRSTAIRLAVSNMVEDRAVEK